MSIRSLRPILAITATSLLACQEQRPESPTAVESASIKNMVTPSVAAALTATGAFSSTSALPNGGMAVISPERAAELAVAYMREFGPHIRDNIEQHHGAQVDLTQLKAEPQVLLSESPYNALPANAGMPFHRALGSYYLVRLRNSSDPVLSVAVSVHATNIDVELGGKMRAIGALGNEFRTWVIPKASPSQPNISPEQAVVATYRAFGELIAEPPRFVRAGAEFTPHIGHWRVVLAKPIQLSPINLATTESTNVVYLGANGKFGVPTELQSGKLVHFRTSSDTAESSMTLGTRPNLAVALREVLPKNR